MRGDKISTAALVCDEGEKSNLLLLKYLVFSDTAMVDRQELPSQCNSTREVFSGPDGNSMCRKTVLDPTFIGESMNQGHESLTTDVRHVFRDSPVNHHPKSKASWVGAIGWDVSNKGNRPDKNDTYPNRIKRSEFRQEVERKAASYPKVI